MANIQTRVPPAVSAVVPPVISLPDRRQNSRSAWPIIGLLALNGLAGVGVWQALERPIDTAPITRPGAIAATDRPLAPDASLVIPGPRAVADLPETARRPLFSASRRPWVEKPKPEVAAVKVVAPSPVVLPPYPANQLRLTGVVPGNRSRTARALIRVGTDTQATSVQVGESIRGWTLREVTLDTAIIETRGERIELVTDAATPVSQNPQPPQPRR
jgi:Type II secretion system protein C